jgi:HAD superfamily hydrolase (TIGR01549 family)
MLAKLLHKIDQYSAISFDIFDTLIIRPYIKPADVFMHIEKLTGLKDFARKRIYAEKKVRETAEEDEITYEEIYEYLGRNFTDAFDFELEFEKRICRRNEEMFAAYQYAVEKGKRIVFVSDMYLPQITIEKILVREGYTDYEQIFISSVWKKRKATGQLYDEVIDFLEVNPSDILHIGDNRKNDVEMALSRGINAFFYPKVIDRFLQENPNMHNLLKGNSDNRFRTDPLTISIIIGINSMIWIGNRNDNYWTKLGTIYAGPFLYYFTRWIYDNARKEGINHIAFAARDGYNLIRIFQIFDRKNEFKARYVYLPRYVSESANILSKSDLKDFFKGLGKTPDALKNFILDFSDENKEIKQKWEDRKKAGILNDTELQNFIMSNHLHFIEASKKKRQTVFNYLERLQLLHENLIIVDSSCTHARPQKLLRKIISEYNLNINLSGYYYKVNRHHKELKQIDIRPEAHRKYQTDKWDMMEFFMSSPERPIVGIKQKGDDFMPVYQDITNNKHEKVRVKASELLTEGIVKFSSTAFGIFEDIPFISNLDTLVHYVNNIINNPTNKDISHIKHLHHSTDNDNKFTPLILNEKQIGSRYRKIYGQRVQVTRLTPEFENYFLGSFDFQVMKSQGEDHLALNVPFINRLPSEHDLAYIHLIKQDGTIEKIDSTYAWNFRYGAFVQYRPGHEDDIIYNIYDRRENKYKSVIYNKKTLQKRVLSFPLVTISSDGKKALCINFFSLNNYPAGYGFSQFNDDSGWKGIFLLDLDTEEYKMILPLKQLFDMWDDYAAESNAMINVNRLGFNTSGSRFVVQLNHISDTMPSAVLTVTADINGNNIRRIYGSAGHIQWKDDKTLFISDIASNPNLIQQPVTAFEVDDLTSTFKDIDLTFFSGMGRGSYSPDRRYILYDSNTSPEFPYRKLQFYDLEKKQGITLGYFYSDPDFYNDNPELKCDLHARWSPCGTLITFDSIHEGYRSIYSIRTEEILKEMERNIETIIEDEIRKIIKTPVQIEEVNLLSKIQHESKERIRQMLKLIIRGRFRTFVRNVYDKAVN